MGGRIGNEREPRQSNRITTPTLPGTTLSSLVVVLVLFIAQWRSFNPLAAVALEIGRSDPFIDDGSAHAGLDLIDCCQGNQNYPWGEWSVGGQGAP